MMKWELSVRKSSSAIGVGGNMFFESKDGCRIPGYPMKVRQLIARLQLADPDAMVLLDTKSHSLLVVSSSTPHHSQRPASPAEPEFTEDDLRFLRQLRIG